MGVPTQKRTKASGRRRSAHFALKTVNIQFDADGNPHLPHRVSLKTGKYKNEIVAAPKIKTKKK